MESSEENELLYNTVVGTLPSSEKSLQNLDFILPSEHFFQDLSRFYSHNLLSPQISLETLSILRNNPNAISTNLVLNDLDEMSHELSILSKIAKIAILETTSFENGKDFAKLAKLSQNLGIPIFIGFEIFVDRKTLFKESLKNEVFLNKETFLKKLGLEFALGGKEGVKFGFIGPVYLENMRKDELETMKIESYFEFLRKSKEKIPIFFDFSEQNTEEKADFNEILGFFIKNSTENSHLFPQIVLLNLPLEWEITPKNGVNMEFSVTLKNEAEIMNLLKMGFQLIFEILRVASDEKSEVFFIEFLAKLIKNGFSQQISVSLGNKFKAHLKKYGGEGFGRILEFRRKIEKIVKIDEIFGKNVLKLLKWKTLEVAKPVAIKMWKCPQCGKEYNDNIEKFKKFEREFCSSKCLREFFSK